MDTKWTRASLSEAIQQHKPNPIDTFMIGIIILAGVTVGLETSPSIIASYGGLLHALDVLFVVLFALEAIIKIRLHTPAWKYFASGWNLFDLLILILTALPLILSMSYGAIESVIALRSLSIIRSLRALRFLRLTSELDGLRIVIET